MEDSYVHLIHTVWSAGLSLLGGMLLWMWNRLHKELDQKVDKAVLKEIQDKVEERHSENLRKFDKLEDKIERGQVEAREGRNKLAGMMQEIVLAVGARRKLE